MAQVFKIKYADTLRRVCAPLYKDGDAAGSSYRELELKVRDIFRIPYTSQVIITYVDTDDDVVTMANDQDLRDACVTQQLNPLKLELKVVSTQSLQAGGEAASKKSTTLQPHTTEFDVEGLLKGLFPESTAKAIEQVLDRYPPCLFTTVPAHVLPEALDTFLRTLTGYRDNWEVAAATQRGHLAKVGVAADLVVHSRSQCDHCLMFPIVGPRYKSTKRNDYDLCSDCFNEVGNTTDYRRMDRRSAGNKLHCLRPLTSVKVVERLDAQFVLDVTVPDGTEVEVGTSFTKVWRLENSGMLPWPQHTRLVCLDDENLFGPNSVVILKLPEGGLSCGSKLDVSVDLKAPENIGYHVAHWRLMAPSGEMFGHRLWVLMKAVPNCMQQTCKGKESLVDAVTFEDADDSVLKSTGVEGCTMSAKEFVIDEAKESLIGEAKEFFVDETTLEDADDSLLKSTFECVEEGTAVMGLFSSSLMVDSESVQIELNSCLKGAVADPPVLTDCDEQHGETDRFSLVEKELVEECVNDQNLVSAEEFELVDPLPHELGSEELNQQGVNQEPLRNSCSEDDSLASTGWDYMLKELEEMGFQDTRTNKNLLLKNEGSIKRAVKELVELEKQMSHKIKAA